MNDAVGCGAGEHSAGGREVLYSLLLNRVWNATLIIPWT
jgi:hypothetical protein